VTTGNGTTWITIKTETTDADGNTVETTEDNSCEGDGCSDDYVNPDYVAFELSPADTTRAMAKLNSVRRPGPDTGDLDPPTSPAPGTVDPTIALFNPDGVTVYAVGTSPSFNRTSPDYDPQVNALSEISGVPIPKSNYS
jgi:hypothetical protein